MITHTTVCPICSSKNIGYIEYGYMPPPTIVAPPKKGFKFPFFYRKKQTTEIKRTTKSGGCVVFPGSPSVFCVDCGKEFGMM